MLRSPQGLVLSAVACALAMAVALAVWTGATDSSEAQAGLMHNCPPASKWSIAVWEGESGTAAGDALATCGADAVVAAYSLDPQTGAWSRWFAGKPDVSNLPPLDEIQGVLALGGAAAAAQVSSPEGLAVAQAGGQLQGCPPPGKWSIAVWDGANGTAAADALATCGAGAVDAAYALDAQTGGWSRWFAGRAEMSTLSILDNMQGVIALGKPEVELPTPTATPAGSSARIVFTRNGALWAIDANGSGLTLLAENSPFYNGSLHRGDTLPHMSSRRDKVAFIGSDNNLWVVDVEGHNLQRLSAEAAPYEEPFCERSILIAGWTPDDAKILYDVWSPGEMCTLRTDVALGFYVIDLESGAKTHLPELPNFVAWLDSERAIYEEQTSLSPLSTEWHAFDTGTGETQKLTELPFECFYPQVSLSYSDNTMVYECGNPDEDTSQIVHANVDNTGQTVLLEGQYAELQHPHVSPNGKAFVFERQRPIGGGVYATDLYHYDLASGGETLVMSGFTSFQEWLDDTRLVALESTESLLGAPSTLYVVDVITGDRTALAEDVDFY